MTIYPSNAAILLGTIVLWGCLACGHVKAAEWNVGLKRITLQDRVSGDHMPGIVAYPTMAAPTRLRIGQAEIAAAETAPAQAGKFPLLIFSHGTGALPELYLWIFEGLAKKGFIVAGVAHNKDNLNDRTGSLGAPLLVERARDVSTLIDNVQQDEVVGEHVDTAKIGVIGHSAGGYTALLLAGGKPDFSQFAKARRCDRDAELGANRNKTVIDASISLTLIAPDSRVRAIAAMAPALGCLFDRKALENVNIPVRLYQADDDENLQPDYNATYFEHLLKPQSDTVRFSKAGHFVFMDSCSFITSIVAREICADPPNVDRSEIHRRILDDSVVFFTTSMN